MNKKTAVKLNDTVVFKLHAATRRQIKGAKLRITVHNSQFFNNGVVSHGLNPTGEEGLEVKVTSLPSARGRVLFYKCELLDKDLNMLAALDGASGGEIVPDSGGG